MSWRAEDLMTRNVVCVYADLELAELAKLFVEAGISGAPVTSRDGELLGVVSQTDLLSHEVSTSANAEPRPESDLGFYETARLDGARASRRHAVMDAGSGTVVDVMTPILYTVPEDAPVEKVASIMRRNRVHRVIVVRQGRVVGLISALDLIAVLSTASSRAPSRRRKAK